MQVCGVKAGMMPTRAGTWQAAPSDAEGPPVWGPGTLCGHTVRRAAAPNLHAPSVAANGKAKALWVLTDVSHFQSCSPSLVKLLCPALFELLHISNP